MLKPIILHSHAQGPNPLKVSIILEELGVKYESKVVATEDLKKEPFEKLNPNGRVPCIEDPNTGVVLWESGAIIEYLIEEYDTSAKISFTTSPEKYHAKQFLSWQVSGQGPYWGQAAWFSNHHPEKVPSAVERYQNEIRRTMKVLDKILSDREYLVGGKCSYADLAFVPWSAGGGWLLGVDDKEIASDYPNYSAWLEKLMSRPTVKKVFADREAANKKA